MGDYWESSFIFLPHSPASVFWYFSLVFRRKEKKKNLSFFRTLKLPLLSAFFPHLQNHAGINIFPPLLIFLLCSYLYSMVLSFLFELWAIMPLLSFFNKYSVELSIWYLFIFSLWSQNYDIFSYNYLAETRFWIFSYAHWIAKSFLSSLLINLYLKHLAIPYTYF